MGRMLKFIKEFDKINICNLTKDIVFEYFFFSKSKILFVVNCTGKLVGVITIGDYFNNLNDIRQAINENYLFVNASFPDKMLSEARKIYEQYKIQTDIPVVDCNKHILGYITDYQKILDKEMNYKRSILELKNKIKKFRNSYYLQEELTAFYEILKNMDIYARKSDVFSEVFLMFGGNIKIHFLSDEEYLDKIKNIIRKKECFTNEEKTELIFDFEREDRDIIYNRWKIDFIYNIDSFMYEFASLVETKEFSRIIRITRESRYSLSDFIDDNGMEDIKLASNKLLTKYVYDYLKEMNIPCTLERLNYIAAMQAGSRINGIRGDSKDCIGFVFCDLTGQQIILNEDITDKNIHVFYVSGAVNAKLTENEEKRVKNFGRLETLIESKDYDTLEQLYHDDCNKMTPYEYAKEIYYSYPVRRRFENDLIVNVDYRSTYVNFENGIRKTCFQPQKYRNTIYFIGPCYALGSFVEDKHTIPSLLAKKLKETDYPYRVINLGMLSSNNSSELVRQLSLDDGDIIINMIYNEKNEKIDNVIDPSNEFNKISDREEMFFDKTVHCNRKGNEIYADVIYENIKQKLKKDDKAPLQINNIYNIFKNNILDLHLYGIQDYLNLLHGEKEKMSKDIKVVGSIVMNCNPFTLGHKYLVEHALKNCEYLIIFVVQEDKSFFKFEDRFAIALSNCKKYNNVSVIPSGNLIISDVSFPEYFKREVIRDNTDVEDDMRVTPVLDFRLFACYIAPVLGIKKRFVAEEPLDKLTEQYNRYMKKVLSVFGISVEEIPRKTLEGNEIISASKVRKMYKNYEFEKMKEMLPDETYNYIVRKAEQYLGNKV